MRSSGLIQKYSFFALGISLSLPIWIQSKVVFLFILIQAFIAAIYKYRISKKGIELALLLIALFLMGLLSLLYSENLQFGLNKITTQLSLLLLPLVVIAYGQKRIEDLSPHFHKGVIAGNLLIILYFSIGMVYLQFFGKLDSVSSNSIRIFDNLLQNYNHRTYVGLALVAGYLSFNSIFETTGIKNTYWLKILYALLIWAILFLLGARSIILVYSMILVIQLFLVLRFRSAIFISLILLSSFMVLFSLHPRLSPYMKSEFAFGEVLRSNVRYDLWTAAWSLIKESPVFGYGLGDGKDLMVEYTSHIDRVTQLQISADAHNQFLQSWLDFGVVGPILVLAILFIYFIKMKKKPDLMRYGLPLLFIIIMFFEVILHRLSGVLLFSTLLLFPPTKTKASPNRIKIFSASLIASALLLILFGILGQLMNQFNSEEPSSYMSLAHSEIEYQNLPDDVPKGIPVGTKGCLLNRNSFEKKLEDNLFAQSIIDEQNVKNGDSIALSVYCYIGETFNGDQVRISGRGQIREPNDRYANMKLRNQWQFLSVNTTADKGRALLVLTIGKQLASDTDSIVGEVIFAYPSMRINKR